MWSDEKKDTPQSVVERHSAEKKKQNRLRKGLMCSTRRGFAVEVEAKRKLAVSRSSVTHFQEGTGYTGAGGKVVVSREQHPFRVLKTMPLTGKIKRECPLRPPEDWEKNSNHGRLPSNKAAFLSVRRDDGPEEINQR